MRFCGILLGILNFFCPANNSQRKPITDTKSPTTIIAIAPASCVKFRGWLNRKRGGGISRLARKTSSLSLYSSPADCSLYTVFRKSLWNRDMVTVLGKLSHNMAFQTCQMSLKATLYLTLSGLFLGNVKLEYPLKTISLLQWPQYRWKLFHIVAATVVAFPSATLK